MPQITRDITEGSLIPEGWKGRQTATLFSEAPVALVGWLNWAPCQPLRSQAVRFLKAGLLGTEKLQWGFSTSRPGLLQALSSDSPLRSSSPHLPWLPPSGADELETNTHTFQKVFKDTDSQNRIQQRSSSPGCSVVWEDGDAGSPTKAQVTGTPHAQPPDSSRLHPAPTPEPQTPRKERLSDLSLPGSHGLSLLTSRTYS